MILINSLIHYFKIKMDNDEVLIPKNINAEKQSLKRRKIIVLGTPGVGKSSIISRFKDNMFLDYYEPTIQNTINKKLKLNDEIIDLEIVDMDGQTEYTILSFNKFAYGIHGYLLVYSIDNRQSFELTKIINSKLIGLIGKKVPRVVVGNKRDLNAKREVTCYEGKTWADEVGCPFVECSAKESEYVKDGFFKLLIEINKSENQINVNNLKCFNLLECFVKKERKIRIWLFVLFVINFLIGLFSICLSVYVGIFYEINFVSLYYIIVFYH